MIVAAAAGTMIEWYDFYIFGSLATIIAPFVILLVQYTLPPDAFGAWGWRIPFLISIVLLGMSLYIRLRMKESPIFQHIKSSGMTSARPLREAFTEWPNLQRVLISLFGATAGQGVVWYTGQFYALFYLQTVLKVHHRERIWKEGRDEQVDG